MAKRTKEQELIIENDILHHMLEKQYADFLSDDEEIENSDNLNAVRTKAKRNLKSPVKVGKNLVEQNTNRINMTEPYDDIEERATKNIKHEVSEYIDKAKYDGEDKNNINLKNVNKKNEVQNKKIRTISRVKLNIDDIVKPKVIDNSINTSKVEEIDEKVSGADNKATKISKNEIIQNEIPAVEEKIEIAEKVNIQSEEKKKAKSKKATKNKILEISKLDEKVVDKFSNDEEINKKLVKDEDTENIELITKIKNIDEINILEDNTKKSKKVKKTNKKEITKNENLVNENEIVVKKKAKKSSQKEALEQENEILEKNKIKKATKNKKRLLRIKRKKLKMNL